MDGLFTTSQPTLSRKHATIPSTPLPAGTYWFYLAGVSPVGIRQGTGTYDDGEIQRGSDADPDLEVGALALGDTFFQIEESVPAVPMVGRSGLIILTLLLVAGIAAVVVQRRYSTA